MISTARADEFLALFPTGKLNEPLSRHTTWGIGGPADFYTEIRTRPELQALAGWARAQGLPLTPIGQGSNLLVGDGGVRGVTARLRGDFETMRFEGDRAIVGAAVLLPQLSRAAAERGLTGAEPLCGVPGTVGGGLMTNAGTPEGTLGDLVREVEVMDAEGRFRRLSRDQIQFSYRLTSLVKIWVLSVDLQLRPGDKNGILSAVDQQLKRRAERQPLGTKNCGSVFKNPPGDYAARLIEAAGLKGLQVGGARVSPKHANFIENTGQATAADVRSLMDTLQRTVQQRFGVALEPEVWTLGD